MTTTIREASTQTQIGRSYPRRDAREKLRGEAQFVGDMIVAPIQAGKACIVDLLGSGSWDCLFVAPESGDQRSVEGPL